MKLFRKVMSIVFLLIAMLWSVVLAKSFFFSITQINQNHIAIIGGADLPTFLFYFQRSTPVLIWCLFIITFTILNIISAFKIKESKAIYIIVIVFFLLTVAGFFLIPPQSYALSLYSTIISFSRTNTSFLSKSFFWISAIITVLTGLSLILMKRGRKL